MPIGTATQALNSEIAAAMREQGVSQQRVADRIGITQSQVSARLRGEIDWRATELDAVSDLLGVTITIGRTA